MHFDIEATLTVRFPVKCFCSFSVLSDSEFFENKPKPH